MLITKVTPLSKNRYEVYADNKLAFVLYRSELRKYSIKEGFDLSDAGYNEIIEEVLLKRAFLRCLHLLEKRDYTEYQLCKKLRDGGYPDKAIECAIEKTKAYGYVNDENYVRRYIDSHIDKKGIRQIQNTLYQRGISSELFKKIIIEFDSEEMNSNELTLINNLLNKRHFFESDKSLKERNKQFNYLMNKGFKAENIRRALEERRLT